MMFLPKRVAGGCLVSVNGIDASTVLDSGWGIPTSIWRSSLGTPGHSGDPPLEGDLIVVAEAAGTRLRAETDQDADAARAAGDALMQAAATAMAAGHSLTEIARAEARGKETIRYSLRSDALKLVERTGTRVRDAQAEHYRAIARATRLGLPMREIAQAAGVTHGTIRAINNRLANKGSGAEDQRPEGAADQGAWPEPAAEVAPAPPEGES